MRLGQTSLVWFASNVGASVIAFLATLYFARELGAAAIGVYSLVVALASWAKLGPTMGIGGAITKRVSEGEDQSEYISAGGILHVAMAAVVAVFLLLLRPYVNGYADFPATRYLVAMLFAGTVATHVRASLKGKHLVHLSGALSPVEIASRSVLQIAFVLLGLRVSGMLTGHVLGTVLIVLLGLYVLRGEFARPTRRHFRSLLSYAQFAWLSTVRSKVFNWIDLVVLGIFVPANLIGIYSVSWTLASFLGLFSGAVRSSVFPEVSQVSEEGNAETLRNLVETSLGYSGLFLIPGLLGSLVIGDRILAIYGTEFTAGATVLVLLVSAYLVHAYGKQFINILNGIDRPDLAFRVSFAYVVVNVVFNLVLVYRYGWTGAAVATLLSAATGLALSFYFVRRQLRFSLPVVFLGKQWIAALTMAGAVYGLRTLEEESGILQHNFASVAVLVTTGAGLYFAILLGLSGQFRSTVRENILDSVAV